MYSDPSAVILMASGVILSYADDAVIDFDNEAVEKYDNLMQNFAETAHKYAEEARRIHASRGDNANN